jgi:hypothetical protein
MRWQAKKIKWWPDAVPSRTPNRRRQRGAAFVRSESNAGRGNGSPLGFANTLIVGCAFTWTPGGITPKPSERLAG